MDTLSRLSSNLFGCLRGATRCGITTILVGFLAASGSACGGRPLGSSMQDTGVAVPDSWQIEWRAGLLHPARIRGTDLFEDLPANHEKSSGDGRKRALSLGYGFMDQYRGLFGLADPRKELSEVAVEKDGLGFTHIHLGQLYQGIQVAGAGVSMHLDARWRLYLLDSTLISTPIGLAVNPGLNGGQATRKALQAVAPGTEDCSNCTADLMIEPDDSGGARLAYRVRVELGISEVWDVVVDALDGRILRRTSAIRTHTEHRPLTLGVFGIGRESAVIR